MNRLFTVLIAMQLVGCDQLPFSLSHPPGDRPSVCFERARSKIEQQVEPMTVLAEALLNDGTISEIGLAPADGARRLELVIVEEQDTRELTAAEAERYAPLFESLVPNGFAPRSFFVNSDGIVVANPSDFIPGLMMLNAGPTCGGSDEEWKAESQKHFSSGVGKGGPLYYVYTPANFGIPNRCGDEEFLFSTAGECQIPINDRWVVNFTFYNTHLDPEAEDLTGIP